MASATEVFLQRGTVKFHSAAKRYGFIDGDDGVARFFTSNELRCGAVAAGTAVTFMPARNARGSYARQVQLA